jgi:peptidoglycan/xylan/chitin deacetylase (PgdA/CDA1 family)
LDSPELLQLVKEGTYLNRPCFHLTFDDGLKEIVTTVAPILKEMGIPATFFINTGFIGNNEIFYRFKASILIENLNSFSLPVLKKTEKLLDEFGIEKGALPSRLLAVNYTSKAVLDEIADITETGFREYTKNHDIYMNEEDIESLLKQGFTIGAHSIDHPEYKRVGPEEQIRQTNHSLKYLHDHFGVSTALFSFPFSDEAVPAVFFNSILKPGGIVDLSFGISGMKKDSVSAHLHRIPMETGTYSAEEIIKGELLWFILKTLIGKNKIHRK